jgi:hypothetical protein
MTKTNEKESKYEFLKSSPYSDFNVSYEQLVEMYEQEKAQIKEEDDDLLEDEIEEEAKNNIRLNLQQMKKGGNIVGTGVPFGFSKPNSYTEMWANQQITAFEKLLEGKGPVFIKINDSNGKEQRVKFTTPDEMKTAGLIRVKKTKTGTKIIACDKRTYSKSGKINKKHGQPYPDSSNMANFIARWQIPGDNKIRTVFCIVGGEMDDTETNPKCPKCGKVGWSYKCDSIITVKKGNRRNKVKCNGVRQEFAIPGATIHAGKKISFPMKVKAEKGQITAIEWSNMTNNSIKTGGLDLTLREQYKRDADNKIVRDSNDNGIKEINGTMMKWIPENRIITSKKIDDFWKNDKIMLTKKTQEFWKKYGEKPVFYFCEIYQISKSEYYGKRTFWASDKTTVGEDEGIKLTIPRHVYDHNIANKIGRKSTVLVVGVLIRTQEKDFKTNQYKTQSVTFNKKKQKVKVFNKPQIDVTCVIPIKARISEKEMEVEKIDLGDILDLDNELDEIPIDEDSLIEEDIDFSETSDDDEEEEIDDEEEEMELEEPDSDDEDEDIGEDIDEIAEEEDDDDEIVEDEEIEDGEIEDETGNGWGV